MGDYIEWFRPDAFWRTNYEGTPVGAVCQVDEPGSPGAAFGAGYLALWSRGKYFSTCAWVTRGTDKFLVVGDPLVKR